MGHTDRERRRLSLQATILNPITEDFLRRAGIAAGMRVLDIGCGVGEVSLIAARLVGSSGHVTGIDVDADSLQAARTRAAGQGLQHIAFEQRDCQTAADEQYDAAIGRHVLIHMRDPLHVIRCAAATVHPGGIVAFQEYDFTARISSFPQVPLFERSKDMFAKLFNALGSNANIGTQLFHLLHKAGLSKPQCRLEAPIDGGPDSPFYDWFAETIRSLLPRLESLGITTAAEIDIETIATRLREETVSRNASVAAPSMISAFARKPTT